MRRTEEVLKRSRSIVTGRKTGPSGQNNSRKPCVAWGITAVTRGLTGAAIRERKTVLVGDVRSAPRYLTAFGSTLSEIIVPIIDPRSGTVFGTIDVESDIADQKLLEECARAVVALMVCEIGKPSKALRPEPVIACA